MDQELRKPKTPTLKNYLSEFSREQLIGQILELSKKFKDVRSYYEFSLNPDIARKTEEVKLVVYECFYLKRGFKLRIKEARRAISDFKKLSPDERPLVDVMLYFVETGVCFTNDFGDINESFYNSLSGMFSGAGKLCVSNGIAGRYKERAEKIVNDTVDIGWGFHEDIEDIFFTYFER